MSRLEHTLIAFFFACWLTALAHLVGLVSLAGLSSLSPRALFVTAAGGGWLTGNVYVQRARALPKGLRRRFQVIYMVGPPGFYFLLWSLAPAAHQEAAPLSAVYAFGVSSVFFLVPVLLRRWPGAPDDHDSGG